MAACSQSPGYERKLAWGGQLAGAEEFDTIVEDLYDSKAIIGWGPGGIILSFRGTASKKNAITDIRVSSMPPASPAQHFGCLWPLTNTH